MMGWVVMGLLVVAVGGLMWRFLPDAGARQFLGAAMLLALAGYAWQGRPGLAGAPKAPPSTREPAQESEFTRIREDMMGQFNAAAAWMRIAERYQQDGDTQGGAQILQSAIRQSPNNPDLWVGLGNALVMHSNGMMTPAAELAFARAAQISPEHPGPPFFRGLALAQGGRYDEAEQVWREILANAPESAEWRDTVREQLRALQAARASGQLGPQGSMPAAPQIDGPPDGGNSAAPAAAGNNAAPAPATNTAAPAAR